MTRRYNLDRAALAAENHRMRLALRSQPINTTEVNANKDIIRLRSELSSEKMMKKAAEKQITELATQLHHLQGGNLAVSSAKAVGLTAIERRLHQTEIELAMLREQKGVEANTQWQLERGDLLNNWNVS